jgi:hypothetical protein
VFAAMQARVKGVCCVEGHLVAREWVVGVDGMFHALSPLRREVLAVRQNKTIAEFLGSLAPLQQLRQRRGLFGQLRAPPPPFFFPSWHLPKVLILQSASA